MDGKLEMSLDKLPVKRLESIEENGFERFPTYAISYRLHTYQLCFLSYLYCDCVCK
jgi:hypothetical protein